tara:strand:+ start:545 stop:1288 length:744 start_codon:yes stop_codon:yes gene_type:complete
MTTRETQQEWKKQNDARKRYYNKWQKLWQQYYIDQGSRLIDYENAFSYASVEAMFVNMYVDVGVPFAKNAFSNTKATATSRQTMQWAELMANYAKVYGSQSIRSISITGLKDARKIIQDLTSQGLEMGLSSAELSLFLREAIPDAWKIPSKFNSVRIARTEIVAAQNEGSYQGALATGLELQKVWLTVMDGRERDSHAAANGQARPMNEPFVLGDGVQISKPGAKGAPPEDTINCRCAVLYEPILPK